MQAIAWNEGLAVGLAFMDETHEELMQLLSTAQAASDTDLPAAWAAVVEHTHGHFGEEDRLMQETSYAMRHCHMGQHRTVLDVLDKSLVRARAGDLTMARDLVTELAAWLVVHVQTMDAALALHLRSAQAVPAGPAAELHREPCG